MHSLFRQRYHPAAPVFFTVRDGVELRMKFPALKIGWRKLNKSGVDKNGHAIHCLSATNSRLRDDKLLQFYFPAAIQCALGKCHENANSVFAP